jgi:peptidoglycan/LPS O-acetylase OafA/YrhL
MHMTFGKKTAGESRIPALDGLRGCAIIAVMFFHGISYQGLPAVSALEKVWRNSLGLGWLGVDLFFVLSGFLITSILLRMKTAPGYFTKFYARRAVRIFPIYYLYLAIGFVILPLLTHAGVSNTTAQDTGVWHITYLQNWLPAFKHGSLSWEQYWQSHLWSLAVEEQFYLLWPLIVLYVPHKRLTTACAVMMVIILLARCIAHNNHMPADIIYRSTLFRFDELLTGCLLASATAEQVNRFLRHSIPLGILLCTATIFIAFMNDGFGFCETAMQSIGFSSAAIIFAALIAKTINDPASRFSRLLEHKTLMFFGKYSYAMYIWHIIIMQYTSSWWPKHTFKYLIPNHLVFMTFSGGITIVAALCSWHLCEQHFIALKKRFE